MVRGCLSVCLLLLAPLWPRAEAAAPPDAARLKAGLVALRSADAKERVRGITLLAACGKAPACVRAARALERALFDANAVVRHRAIGGLVALDARASAGEVVSLLRVERDERVLTMALLALGSLRAAGVERVLTRFASHPAANVRAAALTAAGQLGGRVLRRLVLNSLRMAGDEDAAWLVRSAALVALAKIGKPADLAVIQHAYAEGGGHAFWLARAALARAVAALNPRPQAALERLLVDVDMRVAVTAAKGLADAGLMDVLLGHLRNPQAAVRAAALGGVRQARLSAAVRREALLRIRFMARRDPARGVRWAAAKVLFAFEDPSGDALLLDAIRSREAAIWAEALALLARRTGEAHARDGEAWRAALATWRRKRDAAAKR